jgi:hypothetical protein
MEQAGRGKNLMMKEGGYTRKSFVCLHKQFAAGGITTYWLFLY